MDDKTTLNDSREDFLLRVKEMFAQLTDNERLDVMGDYCKYCGCNDSGCQCWNDD